MHKSNTFSIASVCFGVSTFDFQFFNTVVLIDADFAFCIFWREATSNDDFCVSTSVRSSVRYDILLAEPPSLLETFVVTT